MELSQLTSTATNFKRTTLKRRKSRGDDDDDVNHNEATTVTAATRSNNDSRKNNNNCENRNGNDNDNSIHIDEITDYVPLLLRQGGNDESSSDTTTAHTANQLKITIALCFCMFVHSYLLISVFPYSPFLAIHLLNRSTTTATATTDSNTTINSNDNYNNNTHYNTTSTEPIPIPFINEDTAGMFAGLIASSFMMGRAMTAYYWGYIADTYGRKYVLYSSLGISCIISLVFGHVTDSTFTMALLIRFLLGCFNGIMGTVKTIVSELRFENTTDNDTTGKDIQKKSETQLMSIVMGMWGWGFLISPALSGALSEPVKQYYNDDDHYYNNATTTITAAATYGSNNYTDYYDNTNNTSSSSFLIRYWLDPNTWIGQYLRRYPFVLPNLVASILCFIGFIMVYCHIPETLQPTIITSPLSSENERQTIGENNNSCPKQQSTFDNFFNWFHRKQQYQYQSVTLKSHESDRDWNNSNFETEDDNGTHNNSIRTNDNVRWSPAATSRTRTTIALLLSKHTTRNCLTIFWLYSFINVAVEEIIPLFLISTTAGFGVHENTIGELLSACGIIFAIGQYYISAILYDKYGTYGSIKFGISLLSPIVCFIPLSLLINNQYNSNNSYSSSLNHDADENGTNYINYNVGLHWTAFWFLAIILSAYKLMAIVFFTSISIACNHTVTRAERASMNGLMVLGGSVAKGLGPTFAGILTTQSVICLHQYASILMFGVIAMLSLAVAMTVFYLLNDIDNNQKKIDCENMNPSTTNKSSGSTNITAATTIRN